MTISTVRALSRAMVFTWGAEMRRGDWPSPARWSAALAVAPGPPGGGRARRRLRLRRGLGDDRRGRVGSGNGGTARDDLGGGPVRQALSFPAAGSYVAVPDSASLDDAGMTLEAWVNPSALGRRLADGGLQADGSGMAYALYANNGGARPAGQVNIGGEQNAIGTAQLPMNAWTHLATTYDGSDAAPLRQRHAGREQGPDRARSRRRPRRCGSAATRSGASTSRA